MPTLLSFCQDGWMPVLTGFTNFHIYFFHRDVLKDDLLAALAGLCVNLTWSYQRKEP